jgi:hypothetical protein
VCVCVYVCVSPLATKRDKSARTTPQSAIGRRNTRQEMKSRGFPRACINRFPFPCAWLRLAGPTRLAGDEREALSGDRGCNVDRTDIQRNGSNHVRRIFPWGRHVRNNPGDGEFIGWREGLLLETFRLCRAARENRTAPPPRPPAHRLTYGANVCSFFERALDGRGCKSRTRDSLFRTALERDRTAGRGGERRGGARGGGPSLRHSSEAERRQEINASLSFAGRSINHPRSNTRPRLTARSG